MITIHYDFTDGTEVSYLEGFNLWMEGTHFTTHCLEFFRFEFGDVTIISSKGVIVLKDLLLNDKTYSKKHIRRSHDARKLLLEGSLIWKEPVDIFQLYTETEWGGDCV